MAATLALAGGAEAAVGLVVPAPQATASDGRRGKGEGKQQMSGHTHGPYVP